MRRSRRRAQANRDAASPWSAAKCAPWLSGARLASREIKTLIGDSVSKVGTGSELVNRSGDTLRQIVAAVHEVSGSIGEIAGASQEQATQIDQISPLRSAR